MDRDKFVPIAFFFEDKYYVTSIAEPELGDTVIAFDDYSVVYTYDEERAQQSDAMASKKYTKVILVAQHEREPMKLVNPYAGLEDLVHSCYGQLTKNQIFMDLSGLEIRLMMKMNNFY